MIAPEGLPARDVELYAQYYQALHDRDGGKALSIMKERVESARKTMPPKIRALLLVEYAQVLFPMGDSAQGREAAMESVGLLPQLDNQGQRTVSFALIYVCRGRSLAGDLAVGEAVQEPLFAVLKTALPPQVFWKVDRMFLGQVYNAYRIRHVLSDQRMAVMESWLLEKPDQIDLKFEGDIRLLLAIQYRIRGDLPRMEQHLERVRSIWEGVRNPRVLHLATHGFFFSGDGTRRATGRRALVLEDGGSGPADAWLPPEAGPLLRSGLVLAGANDSSAETGFPAKVS